MNRNALFMVFFLAMIQPFGHHDAMADASLTATGHNWFTFDMPWDDATPGSIVDMSRLNAKPSGSQGWVVVLDGHFALSNTGQRIRFLGTNTVAWHCFPEKSDAEKVARRMSKFGINVVRLHHMDNVWDIQTGSSIWKRNEQHALVIDPIQLDKLDYFIAQLKKQGIYLNLNLKVSKKVSQSDGFPASVSQIKTAYQKGVDKFDQAMIDHQKAFARELITHENPYTGLTYANDPAIAFVEINNENGLLGGMGGGTGNALKQLPQPYHEQLRSRWNIWLKSKYKEDQSLRDAWGGTGPVQTQPVIGESSSWSLNRHGVSEAQIAYPDTQDQVSKIHVQIQKTDKVRSHLELNLPGLHLQDGLDYTLVFRAKATSPRRASVTVMRHGTDYKPAGLYQDFKLTDQWQEYRYVFEASNVDPQKTRLTFKLGSSSEDIWLDDLQLLPGVQGVGLMPGESLQQMNIPIPENWTDNQKMDWVQFLVDVEVAYARTMRSYLKDVLGVKALIIDSQIDWGDFADVQLIAA